MLPFLAQSLMEISWLYALTAFVVTAVAGRPISFRISALCFYASTIAGRFLFNKGRRYVTILVTEAACFAFISLVVLHAFYCPSTPIYEPAWINSLFSHRPGREWVNIVTTLLSTSALWLGGMFLSKRKIEYRSITARFDTGLTMFFCLFLLTVAIRVKGGMEIECRLSILCLFLFLSAGLPAIAMVRLKQEKSRGYLPGYGFFGVLAGFAGTVFFAGVALVLFLTAFLTKTAEVGYEVIQAGARAMLYVIVPLVRLLYGPRSVPAEAGGAPAKEAVLHQATTPSSWWGKALYRIMDLGVKGLVVFITAAVAGLLVYFVITWLMKRSAAGKKTRFEAYGEEPWRLRLWSALRSIVKTMGRPFKRYEKAADAYAALVRWGRRTGISRPGWQTPDEFGAYLSVCFPVLAREIRLIIAAYTMEIYGCATTSPGELDMLMLNLRRLQSPRHWPARAKRRISGSSKFECRI